MRPTDGTFAFGLEGQKAGEVLAEIRALGPSRSLSLAQMILVPLDTSTRLTGREALPLLSIVALADLGCAASAYDEDAMRAWFLCDEPLSSTSVCAEPAPPANVQGAAQP